jgi:hypothetical protein
VWAWWSFPIERECGYLKRAMKSRRFPYSHLANYVVQKAQLEQIKLNYELSEELVLRVVRGSGQQQKVSFDDCESPPATTVLCSASVK